MNEFTIKREFDVDVKTLYDYVTSPDKMSIWFGGTDDMSFLSSKLGFEKLEPWHTKMTNSRGDIFHVQGEVLEIKGNYIRFNWAWVDDIGGLGEITQVEFWIESIHQNKSRWTIRHSGFAQADTAQRHKTGWLLAYHNMDQKVIILGEENG